MPALGYAAELTNSRIEIIVADNESTARNEIDREGDNRSW
jgi:hypothetical protein